MPTLGRGVVHCPAGAPYRCRSISGGAPRGTNSTDSGWLILSHPLLVDWDWRNCDEYIRFAPNPHPQRVWPHHLRDASDHRDGVGFAGTASGLEQPLPRMIPESVRASGVRADHRQALVSGVIHDPFGGGSPLSCAGDEPSPQRMPPELLRVEAGSPRAALNDPRHRLPGEAVSDLPAPSEATKQQPRLDPRPRCIQATRA